MELEDIIYELTCLHESMLFCCEDRFGKEDPVFAHYCMALEDRQGPRRNRAAHSDRNGQC